MYQARDRGLLDFLAAAVALVALYTGTPLGGLVDRAVRMVFDLPAPEQSLIAYFQVAPEAARDRVPGQELADKPLSRPEEQDESLAEVVRKDLEPPLARAFAVVASGGVVTMDADRRPWYDVRPLPHHALDREAMGIGPAKAASGLSVGSGLKERLADALDLVAAYRDRLGGTDAALAAYAVGYQVTERAVSRAKLTGAEEPEALAAFAPYLVRIDADRAGSFVGGIQALRTAYGMKWPLENRHPVTSPFGMRTHPVLGYPRHHDGIDLAAPTGTPIRAAADGEVTYAGSDGVNGLYVKVDHGYGLRTAYCHASQLTVRSGDPVAKGQIIAYVGATGRATGPHLHYGVFVTEKAVDPAIFRPADLTLPYEPEEPAEHPWQRGG